MLKVNLQPKITVEVKEGFKIPLALPIVLFVILTLFAAATFWKAKQDLLNLETEIVQLEFKLRDFQTIITQYKQAESEKKYLSGKREFVQNISNNQRLWTDLFSQIQENIPKDVWLDRMQAERAGVFTMEGSTFTFSSVGFMMLKMNSISHIDTVTLDNTSSASAQEGTSALAAVEKKFRLSGGMKLRSEEEMANEKKAQANAEAKTGNGAKTPPAE